ncbi:MAG: UvrD-helicase domain-containing protein [Kiritimatiellaeota bacterium]|nr:UvrD-helicase domain-containing protein [Kiritimatiellota bacterium]
MSDATIITSPSGIDIRKNAVIEASAGTGKTYTITKLLVRILLEREIPIEKILIVTFTEKATSELKERIRAEITLEAKHRSAAAERESLKAALSNFSNAQIFTIHGFCNKILRENAFETRQPFDLELVDDSKILLDELNSIKREWTRVPDIESILAEFDYNSGWDEKAAKLASAIDWAEDVVIPRPSPWKDVLNASEPISGKVFEVSVIRELYLRSKERKHLNGLISYDDMVGNLRDALTSEENPAVELLSSRLRSNYDIALVDEFQDTNMRQWSIFKNIFFEDSADTGNRLMIIGDPKQAIYGFRGADVHAYEKARDEMISEGASFYRLAVNYRSMPNLTEAFNIFFKEWYGDEARVDSPSDRSVSGPRLGADPTNTAAFNVIAASAPELLAPALKRDIAKQYARKVVELLGNMEIHVGGERRFLTPSDICFLVRSKSEAPFIEEALKRRGIPSSFYKKPGLYASNEALQFQIILSALAKPDGRGMRKALLSIFFRVRPEELPGLEGAPDPNLEARWLRILELALKREWPSLFRELLENSGACFTVADTPRQAANLKQIARELTYEAVKKNLDATTLLGQLNDKMKSSQSTDEALHERDTDKPAVRIMTIHACKGLEFPVVFLFAAMTGKKNREIYAKYYCGAKRVNVYDFSGDAAKTHDKELSEEKINEAQRLFYVAFTRAVFKLFVPVFIPKSKSGEYAKYVLDRVIESKDEMESIPSVANEALPDIPSMDEKNAETETPPSPPIPPNVAFNTRKIRSFSTLVKKNLLDTADFTIGDSAEEKIDDEPSLPLEKDPVEFVKVYPPPGTRTGDVIHTTLEKMDFGLRASCESFEEFRNNEALSALIAERMAAKEFKTDEIRDENGNVVGSLSTEFAKLIWNALGKRLPFLDGKRICDISPEDMKKEMGFLLSTRRDALTGIIDLLFRIPDENGGNTYYILDWKGNHSPDGYRPSTLKDTVMREHGYQLQYELYSLAMKRWFDSLEIDNARLGGAVYLFCRGVNCETDGDKGVVFDDLSRFDMDEIEARLAAL